MGKRRFEKVFSSRFVRDVWSSRLSLTGVILATISAVLIVAALLLDAIGLPSGTYRGLVAYALLPMLFVAGLALIPAGIWLARRRARRQGQPLQPLRIDLGLPEHRRRIAFIALLTLLNSVILTVALYEGYHYTDSNRFCGTLCHTVMEPEYTAYQGQAHARVDCVQCHIGSGAEWYVRAKLSGLRQVWAVLTRSYRTPIPSPVEDLRPARETCEQCHWPEVFHGRKLRVSRQPLTPGEDNLVTAQLLNIGGLDRRSGRYQGIHWHVSSDIRVEYLAGDARRLQIRRVRVHREAETVEFVRDDLPEPPPGAAWRVMDCVDCHNRPAHAFEDAGKAISRAILEGRISRDLPDIASAALPALTADYAGGDAAATGIAAALRRHYSQTDPGRFAAEIERAASALTAIWKRNVFPAMRVGFGTYPNHIGHENEFHGCFRCHDDLHKAADGAVISQDCSLCHETLLQEEKESSLAGKPELLQLLR